MNLAATTVLLIRHGQTDWNAESRWQGHADIPLNATGKAQAHALAQRLAGWPVKALYSSDLKRAAMTADILADALNLKPVLDIVWRERDVGDFQGLTNAELKQSFADHWVGMRNGVFNPPNGEPFQQLQARVTKAFDELLARHAGEMAAVVTHGGALHTLISHILGISGSYGRFSLSGNTGLSIVEQGERGVRLVLLNDTCHLMHMEDGHHHGSQ